MLDDCQATCRNKQAEAHADNCHRFEYVAVFPVIFENAAGDEPVAEEKDRQQNQYSENRRKLQYLAGMVKAVFCRLPVRAFAEGLF